MRYGLAFLVSLLTLALLHMASGESAQKEAGSGPENAPYVSIRAERANVRLYVYPKIARIEVADGRELVLGDARDITVWAEGTVSLENGTRILFGKDVTIGGETFHQPPTQDAAPVTVLADGTVSKDLMPAGAGDLEHRESTQIQCLDANVFVSAYQPLSALKSPRCEIEFMSYEDVHVRGNGTMTIGDGTSMDIGKQVKLKGKEYSGPPGPPLNILIDKNGKVILGRSTFGL